MSTPANSTVDPTAMKLPHRRRWIPLSLRMFVAIIAMLGVGTILWVGVPAYRQHAAVLEVDRLGGQAEFRDSAPDQIRRLLGYSRTRLFETVIAVEFWGKPSSDSDLSCLQAFPNLSYLSLMSTRISDNGIKDLQTLRRLETIQLSDSEITDVALAHVSGIKSLKCLELGGTRVTDSGLAHLK